MAILSLYTKTPAPLSSFAKRGRLGLSFFSTKKSKPETLSFQVLYSLANRFNQIRPNALEETAVVCVHHSLLTSTPLLNVMIKGMGLKPENTFVLGKRYSAHDKTEELIRSYGIHYHSGSEQAGLGRFSESFIRDIGRLWDDCLKELLPRQDKVKNIIVLDHGGELNKFVPYAALECFKVIGVEKTTSGLVSFHQKAPLFPVINVASCIAKIVLESPLIAEAVMTKLEPVIDMMRQEPIECGVIGFGAIGRAIADKLLSFGHRVIVYDNNPEKLRGIPAQSNLVVTNDLSSLVNFSKLIFGCSGADVTKTLDAFRLAPADKTLISCSSEDREFLTLLLAIQEKINGKGRIIANSFEDVEYTNAFGKKIKILRAGFPYNFDLLGVSVPEEDIQFTRALVLASVLQAVDFLGKKEILAEGQLYSLDETLQQFVALTWLETLDSEKREARYSQDILRKFHNLDWIREQSPGIKASVDFASEFQLDESHSPGLRK